MQGSPRLRPSSASLAGRADWRGQIGFVFGMGVDLLHFEELHLHVLLLLLALLALLWSRGVGVGVAGVREHVSM